MSVGINSPASTTSGNVVGPASALDGKLVAFDGTTGKLLKDTGVVVSGTNTGDQTSVSGNAGTVTTNANLTGPVTSSGNATAIAANVVANAKLAQMATKTYKGRTSALTGDPEDVAVATVKTDLGLVKADVGLGNVDNTSDANKPVSTATQSALDLKHTNSMATNKLLGRGTAATGVIEEITLGTNLTLSGTTLNAASGAAGDIALTILAPAVDETITAGYSAVVVRQYAIASGKKLTIGLAARMRLL